MKYSLRIIGKLLRFNLNGKIKSTYNNVGTYYFCSMIKSITFNEGGYITQKTSSITLTSKGKEKVNKLIANRGEEYVSMLSDDGLVRNAYLNKSDYREKHKPLNPHLHKTLLNKTFEFSPNKINVIFGPNASGKSTIIKSLASYCSCGDTNNLDGWTNGIFLEPSGWSFSLRKEDIDEYERFLNEKKKNIKNNVSVVWDGVPVYNDNFGSRQARGFGDLCGSIFEGENSSLKEFTYMMEKDKISLGQNTMFVLNNVLKMVKDTYTFNMFLHSMDEQIKKWNDSWVDTVHMNMRYVQEHYDKYFGKLSNNEINTVLFDELDKSLDIENTAYIYQTFLPNIIKEFNIQIILVSHSPLILTNKVIGNTDAYNVISMDEKYTENCRKQLKNFSF